MNIMPRTYGKAADVEKNGKDGIWKNKYGRCEINVCISGLSTGKCNEKCEGETEGSNGGDTEELVEGITTLIK